MSRVRVLVVDDSALMRELLADVLASDPGIEVIGTASDPYTAWSRIQLSRPDVLTLDVEMPRMDGLTFLAKLMRIHPMPVVMVSSLTERGGETTLRALELGAVDFVTKPRVDLTIGISSMAAAICEKVRTAAGARIRRPTPASANAGAPAATPRSRAVSAPGFTMTHGVIAVGASTGGTEALRELITALPVDAPGMVVVQHMPERFTQLFASRIDGLARVRVKEAEDGDRVLPGHVLIAPGNRHMEVRRSGAEVSVQLQDGPPVNRHRPSVDVLFDSCARHLGANVTGVILTGMGADGARGLLAMRQAGARTIAQDEATCVVFGMPKEAIALGGAARVLPLGAIAATLLSP